MTAGLFNLYDKKNKWNVFGNAYTSTLFNSSDKNSTGYKYGMGMGKVSGQLNFQTAVQVIGHKFKQVLVLPKNELCFFEPERNTAIRPCTNKDEFFCYQPLEFYSSLLCHSLVLQQKNQQFHFLSLNSLEGLGYFYVCQVWLRQNNLMFI